MEGLTETEEKEMSTPADYRPLTEDERKVISQMRFVRMMPGSWEKRFYHAMMAAETITDKQAAHLWRLFIRYRRQMAFPAQTELLEKAEKLAAKPIAKLMPLRRI